MTKKRDANMDYLKVLSIIRIVFFHYFWNADYNWAAFNAPQQVLIAAAHMFGELGVDCFALVSGYYLSTSKKPFRAEKLWNLWKQIFMYSVLSMVHSEERPGRWDDRSAGQRSCVPGWYWSAG